MRLKLFHLIDEAIMIYQENLKMYQIIEQEILTAIATVLKSEQEYIIDYQSRIKSQESLREKIIRNRYYIKYDNANQMIDSLSDMIGIRIECRFLKDEVRILEKLQSACKNGVLNDFPQCIFDFETSQPQKQKNGLNIYRVDGVYHYQDKKVKFELQIKSLVNAFWGSIEHKLVYKNKHYLDVDDFMSEMLLSINQSLNVLDTQLNIIYDQIQNFSKKDVESNEKGIEVLITKAINDVFSTKMKENLGFSLSIKYTSKILASYMFNKDIRFTDNGEDRIASLLKILRKISITDLDFEQKIAFESTIVYPNRFQQIFGEYLLKIVNEDYDWYVFFKMLFAIEPGNNQTDFLQFLAIMEHTLIDDYWFKTAFSHLNKEEREKIQIHLIELFTTALIHDNSVQIVSSVTSNEMNQIFRQFVFVIEKECNSLQQFLKQYDMYQNDWCYIASQILNNDQ